MRGRRSRLRWARGGAWLSVAAIIAGWSAMAGVARPPGRLGPVVRADAVASAADSYWLASAAGDVYSVGASYWGAVDGSLVRPVVGMAATLDGRGYWLAAADGGIFTFGDAHYYGSMGGHPLNKPIVAMAPTPDGHGYWLAAADGGIFTFGDAHYYGSMGGHPLDKPVVAMAPTPDGHGYWLAAADGGIFTFGDAPFYGSVQGQSPDHPVVAMAATVRPPATSGYNPCPAAPTLGPATANTEPVRVPAAPYLPIPGASDVWSFPPAALRPAGFDGTLVTPTAAGSHPPVVLMHGIGGSQCQVWWLAEYLATQGFEVLTLNVPDPAGNTPASYGVAIDAARSGVAYVGSPASPGFPGTITDDVGLAGWSQGAVATSEAQAMPGMGEVRAIVALDNLRAYLQGDPGAPIAWCGPPPRYPVAPRVPALSFASDHVCPQYPSASGPDLKEAGWQAWRQAGVPAVEMVMAGFSHTTFTSPSPPVAAVVSAWLSTWLSHTNQLPAVTACTIAGRSGASLLSSMFHSAVYLPASHLDTNDWRGYLATHC